ncbi:hypothetical protein ACP4OV_002322 [Aristida adscensionis]
MGPRPPGLDGVRREYNTLEALDLAAPPDRSCSAYYSPRRVTATVLALSALESSNAMNGIGFTKCNEWSSRGSLRGRLLYYAAYGPPNPNPYERAIYIIGQTLSLFDEDNLIPCFGFGGASSHDQDIFSFYTDNRPCHGFEEAVTKYRQIVPHLKLSSLRSRSWGNGYALGDLAAQPDRFCSTYYSPSLMVSRYEGLNDCDQAHAPSRSSEFVPDNYSSLDEVTGSNKSSNIILGVDFTKHNRWSEKHTFRRKSLQTSNGISDPYGHAISIIERILSPFDDANLIPGFGFGDDKNLLRRMITLSTAFTKITIPLLGMSMGTRYPSPDGAPCSVVQMLLSCVIHGLNIQENLWCRRRSVVPEGILVIINKSSSDDRANSAGTACGSLQLRCWLEGSDNSTCVDKEETEEQHCVLKNPDIYALVTGDGSTSSTGTFDQVLLLDSGAGHDWPRFFL